MKTYCYIKDVSKKFSKIENQKQRKTISVKIYEPNKITINISSFALQGIHKRFEEDHDFNKVKEYYFIM